MAHSDDALAGYRVARKHAVKLRRIALIGTLIGGPLGISVAVTGRGRLYGAPAWNRIAGAIVNATRSIPFIILAVAIIPFTRLVAGTSIGTSSPQDAAYGPHGSTGGASVSARHAPTSSSAHPHFSHAFTLTTSPGSTWLQRACQRLR